MEPILNVSEFEKFIESVEYDVENFNNKFMDTLKNKNDNNIIATRENLSIFFSEGLIEDSSTILSLHASKFSKRYIDYIIRGMVEHVIEYKYLIQNETLISEYFGSKVKDKKSNITKMMRNISQDRYENGKLDVKAMAKAINEDLTYGKTKEMSLYDIFSIISGQSHNAYYHSYLYLSENKGEGIGLDTSHIIYLITIISKFMEDYKKI